MEGPWNSPPVYEPPSAEACAAVAEVYHRVDAVLAPVASACRACGKCCRFEPGGIVLFASAVELAYLVAETPAARAPTAGDSWRCPYQRENLCTARGARLLGCRTYFCDAKAREVGEDVYADALREIRRIAAGQGPWWYGPARVYLEAVTP